MRRRLLAVLCAPIFLSAAIPASGAESDVAVASPASTASTPIRQTGKASFYGHGLDGRKTASGERYDPRALTAAHKTLPMGTRLRVVNPKNDRSVVVTVNDRGPVPKGRMLDLSSAAADQLGIKRAGVARVHTEVVGESAGTATAATPASDPPAR